MSPLQLLGPCKHIHIASKFESKEVKCSVKFYPAIISNPT